MTNSVDSIEARLRAGEDISYDDAADLFQFTQTGQAYGVERAEILVYIRARFPTEAALSASMREHLAAFDALVRRGVH